MPEEKKIGDRYPCECGCGEDVVIRYTHVSAHRSTGKWPRFLKYHYNKMLKKDFSYKLGD